MTVHIQVDNDPAGTPFMELEDKQFKQLWSFMHLPLRCHGSMYGIKMRNILTEAGKSGVYTASVNDMITGMDAIRYLGTIIDAAMQREEKIIWRLVNPQYT